MPPDNALLFPFAAYWWFYLAFTGVVVLLLAADLGIFHRKAHAVRFGEALAWTAVWAALALAFNAGLYFYASSHFGEAAGKQVALEFLAGYVLEESLSVDNMFVFLVVFGYFGIPREVQHRVLFFGILGALVFRAIFIAAGSELMQFQPTVYVFGGLLIVTGARMLWGGGGHSDPAQNPALRFLRRIMPVTEGLRGSRFVVREAGRWMATPLLVCLLLLEMTDILFAVDSVPAIFGVTREPLVVFTSNIFAILGLRSLFFLLAGAMHRFYLLQYGLAVVLIFVGLKMTWLNHIYQGHFPISWSLGVILSVIAVSMGLSLAFPAKPRETPAVPGGDAASRRPH